MENEKVSVVAGNVAVEESTDSVPVKREFAPYRKVSMRVCKRCGKMYVLTDSEAKFFFEKFGTLPSKCGDCRKKARENNASNETDNAG